MKILKSEQGTLEWMQDRICKVTSTRLAQIMGGIKPKLSLISELIAEEGTERVKQTPTTLSMERGNEEEPFAVKAFENHTGMKTEKVGLCVSEDADWLANSPDRKVVTGPKFTDALEVKNPNSDTFVYEKILNTIPLEELGYGTWSKPTKENPEPVFKPYADAPFCGIPSDYKWQAVMYFIVNPDLQNLHFGLHDVRFINPEMQFQYVVIKRDNPVLQEAIQEAQKELVEFRTLWMKCREAVLPSSF